MPPPPTKKLATRSLRCIFQEGRKDDAGMLADPNLLADLNPYALSPAGRPLCIYGDPAYSLRVNLQSPFRNAVLTAQREAYNEAMSSVRSSVEWLFGDIVNYFKFLDFKKNLKLDFELSRENVYC